MARRPKVEAEEVAPVEPEPGPTPSQGHISAIRLRILSKLECLKAIRASNGNFGRAADLLNISVDRLRKASLRWPEIEDAADEAFRSFDLQRYEAAESIKTTLLKNAARKAKLAEKKLARGETEIAKLSLSTSERLAMVDALKNSREGRRRYPTRVTTVVQQTNQHLTVNQLSSSQVRSLSDEELDGLIDGDTRVLERANPDPPSDPGAGPKRA
jgi:hypothetical protein